MAITRSEYNEALLDAQLAKAAIESSNKTAATFQDLIATGQATGADTTAAQAALDRTNTRNAAAQEKLASANAIVTEFNSQTVTPSDSETTTQNKYENSEVVAASTNNQEATLGNAAETASNTTELGRTKQVPSGAIPLSPKPASVNFRSMAGESVNQDMRVKIRVPENYLTQLTQGPSNELRNLKGIIFPYTPSLSIEHKADYASQAPMHSNYAIYFYQRSSVSPINISGKFTVSNEAEAAVYIATIHLLRSLTKMRSGGATGDADSGAPPPVCRLDAYGTFMLQNVPVAISSFKIDLPDNVDYYTLGKKTGTPTNSTYEMTSVPVVSTISVTCIPIYSRDEMQKFNVTQWLDDKYVRKAGFL